MTTGSAATARHHAHIHRTTSPATACIDRRALLGRGLALAGATGAGVAPTGAAAEPLKNDPWSLEMGAADAGAARRRRSSRSTWCAR